MSRLISAVIDGLPDEEVEDEAAAAGGDDADGENSWRVELNKKQRKSRKFYSDVASAGETLVPPLAGLSVIEQLSHRLQRYDARGESFAKLVSTGGDGVVIQAQRALFEMARPDLVRSPRSGIFSGMLWFMTGLGVERQVALRRLTSTVVRLSASIWARMELKCPAC